MIVISLFGLFMGAVYQTSVTGLRVANATGEREQIRQQLSNALDRLTREARMSRNIDHATITRFRFDADFDGDGSSTGNETNINYELQSGALVRDQASVSLTLVENATSLEFDYIDLNGADMTPPVTGGSRDDIRVMQVTVTATDDDESISMAASAFLTNM